MKIHKALGYSVVTFFIIWFLLSWVDIFTHNSNFWDSSYAQYQSWNLIIMLMEVLGV